jgi:hypothetical protein
MALYAGKIGGKTGISGMAIGIRTSSISIARLVSGMTRLRRISGGITEKYGALRMP